MGTNSHTASLQMLEHPIRRDAQAVTRRLAAWAWTGDAPPYPPLAGRFRPFLGPQSPARREPRESLGCPPRPPPPQFHGPESRLAPVHDEHAEALLHAHLDVVLGGWVAARHAELLARRQHLLDRVLPALLIE